MMKRRKNVLLKLHGFLVLGTDNIVLGEKNKTQNRDVLDTKLFGFVVTSEPIGKEAKYVISVAASPVDTTCSLLPQRVNIITWISNIYFGRIILFYE